ncbi:hypothetical protein COLO4_02526 [Corchorus olitorius]|uniref:Uncharacterized protein n=1 Tax=Corchorus olitorius TaxID=93759 RepID=A0A1R3L0T1_9ROSI|nr:hypothetical protein COLO4_02526 [Corchorus olitorius]
MAFFSPMENQGVSGALIEMPGTKEGDGHSLNTMVYFPTQACTEEEGRVQQAGGHVVRPKFSIGDFGFCSICTDSEGNAFEFDPSSDFEGSWAKGAKIIFTAEGEKKEGMIARIRENIPAQFVSIEHYGILSDGEEITEGPQVESWAGSQENYTFDEKDGVTTLTVDVDTDDKYLEFFNETWPRALNKLKAICEASN